MFKTPAFGIKFVDKKLFKTFELKSKNTALTVLEYNLDDDILYSFPRISSKNVVLGISYFQNRYTTFRGRKLIRDRPPMAPATYSRLPSRKFWVMIDVRVHDTYANDKRKRRPNDLTFRREFERIITLPKSTGTVGTTPEVSKFSTGGETNSRRARRETERHINYRERSDFIRSSDFVI